MQKYLRELQPSTFEDLIAMNALYRPGPMDYIPDFIDRKWGRKPIEYDIPIMEKYLKDTYGITVYQEAGHASVAVCWQTSPVVSPMPYVRRWVRNCVTSWTT